MFAMAVRGPCIPSTRATKCSALCAQRPTRLTCIAHSYALIDHVLARVPLVGPGWVPRRRRAVVPVRISSSRSGGRRSAGGVRRAVDDEWGAGGADPAGSLGSGEDEVQFQRNLWSALDACGWVGSVAGAAAFVLTQELWLIALPLVLPLLAVVATRQKERLLLQDTVRRYEAAAGQRSDESALQLRRMLGALRTEVAQQLRDTQAVESQQLQAIQAKLAALEGSVVSTGRVARDAATNAAGSSGAAARELAAMRQHLAGELRQQIAEAARAGASSAAAGGGREAAEVVAGALSRMENRLAALEGSVGSLEASQGGALRALSSGVTSALSDAERSLEAAVRSEAFAALEPVRRLPQLLAAATDVAALPGAGAGRALGQLVVNEERIAGLLTQAVRSAVEDAMGSNLVQQQQQQLALQQQQQGAALAPQQWGALGRRLAGIEQQLQDLAGNQAPASNVLAAASLAAQLADLKGDVAVALQQLAQQQQQLAPVQRLEAALESSLAPLQRSLEEVQSGLERVGGGLGSVLQSQAQMDSFRQAQADMQDSLKDLAERTAEAVAAAQRRADGGGASGGEEGSESGVLTAEQLEEQLSPLMDALRRMAAQSGSIQTAPDAATVDVAAAASAQQELQQLQRSVQEVCTTVKGLTELVSGMAAATAAVPSSISSGDATAGSRQERPNGGGAASAGTVAASAGGSEGVGQTPEGVGQLPEVQREPPNGERDAASSSSREDAYQRMQGLLATKRPPVGVEGGQQQQQAAGASIGPSTSPPADDGPLTPIDAWIDSGGRRQRQQRQQPGSSASSSSSSGGPSLQEQIQFAASWGLAGPAAETNGGYGSGFEGGTSGSGNGGAAPGGGTPAEQAAEAGPGGGDVSGAIGGAPPVMGNWDEVKSNWDEVKSNWDESKPNWDESKRPQTSPMLGQEELQQQQQQQSPSSSGSGYVNGGDPSFPEPSSWQGSAGPAAANSAGPMAPAPSPDSTAAPAELREEREEEEAAAAAASDSQASGREEGSGGTAPGTQPLGTAPPEGREQAAYSYADPPREQEGAYDYANPPRRQGAAYDYADPPREQQAAYAYADPPREQEARPTTWAEQQLMSGEPVIDSSGAVGGILPGLTPAMQEQDASALLQTGLQLLRAGRRESKAVGGDLGVALLLLRGAGERFARVAELEPDNIKALGNWGNALLAHGEVKKALLSELEAAPPPDPSVLDQFDLYSPLAGGPGGAGGGRGEYGRGGGEYPPGAAAGGDNGGDNSGWARGDDLRAAVEAAGGGGAGGVMGDLRGSVESARVQLRSEAESLLVDAGRRFRRVLELQERDARALTNWGKALCLRAALAGSPQQAAKLLGAAVQKLELALDVQPGFRPALRDCGLALRDLAFCQPQGSEEAEKVLVDAAEYLQAALDLNPEDGGVAELLQEVERELAANYPGRGYSGSPLGSPPAYELYYPGEEEEGQQQQKQQFGRSEPLDSDSNGNINGSGGGYGVERGTAAGADMQGYDYTGEQQQQQQQPYVQQSREGYFGS